MCIRDRYSTYLAISDLFVSPSISELESIPITLLESLYVGTPVVGTFIGGTAECVPNDQKVGCLVHEKDSTALAECILLMVGKKKEFVFHKSKTKLKCVRSWFDVASDYLNIYRRLIKNM